MDREALIENLKLCREKVLDYNTAAEGCQAVQRQLEELAQEPKKKAPSPERLSGPWKVISFAFSALLCLCVCLSVELRAILATDRILILVAVCVSLIACTVLSQIVGFAAGRIETERQRQENELRYRKERRDWEMRKKIVGFSLQQDLSRYETQMREAQTVLQDCARQSGLHTRYQRPEALGHIIRYLETGRSDTLKDALNLYESELARYWQRERELRYRQRLERIIQSEFQQLRREVGRNNEAVDRSAAAILRAVKGAGEEKPGTTPPSDSAGTTETPAPSGTAEPPAAKTSPEGT